MMNSGYDGIPDRAADPVTTGSLEKTLRQAKPDDLAQFFADQQTSLIRDRRPFMAYMDEKIKARGLTKQAVLLAADLPEKYGYRLLEEERHNRKRDVYLRICYAAGLSLKESQQALRLAGHEKLYARIPRDAVLIVGFNECMNVDAVNELLKQYDFEPLKACGENE